MHTINNISIVVLETILSHNAFNTLYFSFPNSMHYGRCVIFISSVINNGNILIYTLPCLTM